MPWNSEIKFALDKVLQSQEPKRIAVFDADGTLWHDDLGEAFFKFQIENRLAPGLKGVKEPWNYYREYIHRDAAGAYGWLAQINAGLDDTDLHRQSQEFYEKHFRQRLNSDVKGLIKSLQSQDFEIWICSASIKWAIAPALRDLNIPDAQLIAVEVELDSKKHLTQKLIEPLPYRPGKKFWLEKKLSAKPLLVAGNSMGDLEMMGLATVLPLTIIFKPHLPEIKESEEGLIIEASRRGWPIQIFQ